MPSIPMILTFWPGLPQLWLYGRWLGLLKAVGFAAFLNFVLFATCFQLELVSPTGLFSCWIILGLSWTIAIFQNDWIVKEFALNESKPNHSAELDALFNLAQSEYLQGHFEEAENLLERLIRLDPRDLEARIYLATIFRHQGRLHQATKQLEAVETCENAAQWRFQIEEERKLISTLESELRSSLRESTSEGMNLEQNNKERADHESSIRPAA
ncbi:MAG: tetratricopeptide repeat protein [Planctomycetota bacterium]|nr:tetratricopeptide repeat protein [Planctomycetota bacterium]